MGKQVKKMHARTGGRRRLTARMTIDYRSAAEQGEWLHVLLDRAEENGRKTLAFGRLMAGERLVAEVNVLFVDAPVVSGRVVCVVCQRSCLGGVVLRCSRARVLLWVARQRAIRN